MSGLPTLSLASLLGRREEALEAAQRAVAIAPQDPLALELLASLLMANGRHAEALPLLRRAVEISADPERWTAIGIVQVELGQRDLARAAFESALALNPNFAEARAKLDALDRR